MSPLNITQPLGIWSIMATIFGDVQYSQVMGHLPTPVECYIKWTARHRYGSIPIDTFLVG